MRKIENLAVVFVIGAAILISVSAQAVAINVDTTVTVSADNSTDYEIAAGATLTFSVASGATYTLSGVISGEGAVRIDGGGRLRFANSANSFSGGLFIYGTSSSGSSSRAIATASGAFGTSPITNSNYACVVFDCKDGVFPNTIYLINGNTPWMENPDNMFVQFRQDTVLKGGITAIGAHLMLANSRTAADPTTGKGPRAVIEGPINVSSGYRFQAYTYGTNTFYGAINDSGDAEFMGFNLGWSNGGTLEFGSSGNVWEKGLLARNEIISCLADNVISNAIIKWQYVEPGMNPYGDYHGAVKLNGHSQRIRSLTTGSAVNNSFAADADNGYRIESSAPATLTILGEATDRDCGCRIQDEITVVVDAQEYPSFVQTITKRTCPTTGNLVVSNGTLRLAETASFPNVPNLVIGAGGTLDMKSSVGTTFGSVTNFILDGIFTSETVGASGFAVNQMDMTMGSGAELRLAAGDTLTVKSLNTNSGRIAADTYTAADGRIPQLKSGTLVVLPSAVASSATWTGAGVTDAIDNVDNWSDSAASVVSGMDATFASGGDHAVVSSAVRFGNLTFTPVAGTEGFLFDGSGASASFAMCGDWMSLAGPATNIFNVPVETATSQEWIFRNNAILCFNNGFSSATDTKITLGGVGETRFNGLTEVLGGLTVTNGMTLSVKGAFGLPDGSAIGNPAYDSATTLSLRGWPAILSISNATVRMPVYLNTSIERNPIVAASASTNVFLGKMALGSNWSGFDVPRSSEIILRGGFVSGGASLKLRHTYGTVRIQDVPINVSQSLGLNCQNGTLVFEVAGNTFNFLTTGHQPWSNSSVLIDFRVSQAVSGGCFIHAPYWNDSRFVPSTASGFTAMVEFHSTTQSVNTLIGYPLGVFRGDAGSLIEVKRQTTVGLDNRVDAENIYVASDIAGALSLKMSGTGDLVLTNRAFSSCGDLEVVSGTLSFANDATWLNGSNVTVRGTGTLRLAGGGRFGKHVAMHLGEDGESWRIAMPNGGTQRVAHLYAADGTLLPSGQYGASGVAGVTQTRYSSHFEGTGLLRVGELGTRIILR